MKFNIKLKLTYLTLSLISIWSIIGSAQSLSRPLPTAPQVSASQYILLDYDSGHVIASSNPDQQAEPASLTKLMATYVVFHELKDQRISLDDSVLISEKAWRMPGSRMFIEVDKQVSVIELLKGLIIQSGNDATVALAEHIAGSEEAFVSLMNQYAQKLGMTHSNFVDSSGLPAEGHLTSARDMAILASAIIREFPDYYNWFAEKEMTYNNIRQQNRNTLLFRDPTVDGLKTGHTESAGYCLVSSAKRSHMRLISVVMGSKSEKSRADDSQRLLGYGFRFFETRSLYQAQDVLSKPMVWKGETDTVELVSQNDIVVTIPRGSYKLLEADIQIPKHLEAPIEAGQHIGQLRVKLGDNTVIEAPLVAQKEVKAGGLWKRTSDSLKLWASSILDDL